MAGHNSKKLLGRCYHVGALELLSISTNYKDLCMCFSQMST